MVKVASSAGQGAAWGMDQDCRSAGGGVEGEEGVVQVK